MSCCSAIVQQNLILKNVLKGNFFNYKVFFLYQINYFKSNMT